MLAHQSAPPITPPSSLRTGALAIAVGLIATTIVSFGYRYLIFKLSTQGHSHYSEYETWFSALGAVALCTDLVVILGLLCLVFGAWPKLGSIRSKLIHGVALAALFWCFFSSNFFFARILLGQDPSLANSLQGSWAGNLVFATVPMGWLGLALVLREHTKNHQSLTKLPQVGGHWSDSRTTLLFTLSVIGIFALSAFMIATKFAPKESFLTSNTRAMFTIASIPGILAFFPLSLMALTLLRLENLSQPRITPSHTSDEWVDCGKGLSVYSRALGIKVVVLALSSLFLLVALSGKHPSLARSIAWLSSLSLIAIALTMLWALSRISTQPFGSPAKGLALLAFLGGIVSSLLELYSTYLALRIPQAAKSGSLSYRELVSMQERLASTSKYGMYLGLVVVLLLVLSLRTLFIHWQQRALAKRCFYPLVGIALTMLFVYWAKQAPSGQDPAYVSYRLQRSLGFICIAITIALGTVVSLRALMSAAASMLGYTPSLAKARATFDSSI